jgi:upstream activation factor subunit UAF30
MAKAAVKKAPAKKGPAKKTPTKKTSAKTASAKKATTKKAPAKKAPAKKKSTRKINPALMKPLQPSPQLSAVVGAKPLPRPEVVSKVWDYIKKNKLQNPENKREILADDKLQGVFGKKKVTMFEMNKHLAQHLK